MSNQIVEYIQFEKLVETDFGFLISEFNYKPYNRNNRTNFYDIQYKDSDTIISISLEPIENYFQVILFKLDNGNLPDYDDKTKTIHLSAMRTELLVKVENSMFEKNNQYFETIEVRNDFERIVLKAAKDLRLCLKVK